MTELHVTSFIRYLQFEKRYTPHTVTAYQTDLGQFFQFLHLDFDTSDVFIVSHFHIRSWLASLKDEKQTERTINRKISSLSAFFRYLQKQGLVKKNPVKQLHALRLPERLPAYAKNAEIDALFEEVDFGPGFKGATDRMICELLYQTGMRRNELIQLKETDIEWSLEQMRIIGKGNKERLVPMGDMLLSNIKAYIEDKKNIENADRNHLLILENGQPLYAGYVYRVVKQHLGTITTLNKKSPHILRHTFATHLLANGANIQAIKDLLGHSSLAATQVYTHNNIDQLKEIHKLSHPRG